jgi:hypothetical protein
MITQELTAYVKAELNRGKNPDEVRNSLLSGGGWSETDITEVFNHVMPKDSMAINIPQVKTPTSSFVVPTPVNKKSNTFPWKWVMLAIVCGVLFFGIWQYRDTLSDVVKQINSMVFKKDENVEKIIPPIVTPEAPKAPVVLDPINCGVTNSPNRKDATTYLNDNVLKCLGENAINCIPAEATINDSFFPTMFKITKKDEVCQFSLAYSNNTPLVDVTGKNLAGRNIFCPLAVVKTMDEKDPKNTVFRIEDIDNPNKYAKDIYFYGTLGLFIENNFDQAKINNLGCSGSFIGSVIESYNLMKNN